MLSFEIARRYLFAPKSHNAVNIISLVALCGVAVAAMAMVVVMSVFNGFTDLASGRLSALDPPLLLSPEKGKVIVRADSLAGRLEELPEVKAAMPIIIEQGLAIYGDHQLGVTLTGVDSRWGREMNVAAVVIDGEDLTDSPDEGFATIGVGPAARLGAHPDLYAPLMVYVPRRTGRYNPANPMNAFMADTLRVSAVYRTEQAEHDQDRIAMPVDALRDMLEYSDGEATAIQLIPAAGVSVKALRNAVGKAAPDYRLQDRLEQQAHSFRMIRIEKWITFLMLVFIMVIASFNIISTLSLLIIEKEPSVAILNALGANKRMIDRIFVIQGWMISACGGLAGIILGTVLVMAQQWGGFVKLGGDPSQLSISVYPVRLEPLDLLAVMGIVVIVGFVTGIVTLAAKKVAAK